MKVLAPLRNSDEVLPLCDAGAHEFYCGLTPPGWEQAFGRASVHRRNPASAGVPSLDDLRRIVALAGSRPVFATLNAPSYPAGAVPHLVEFGRTLLDESASRLSSSPSGSYCSRCASRDSRRGCTFRASRAAAIRARRRSIATSASPASSFPGT